MPTPMPIMAASCGPNVGTTTPWLEQRRRCRTPMPMPNRAVRIGRPMAITEPKATSRMMIAAAMPMTSLAPGCGEDGLADRLTAELDLQAGHLGRLGGVDDLLHLGGGEIVGLSVELHDGEGDVRVDLADLRLRLLERAHRPLTWGSPLTLFTTASMACWLAGEVTGSAGAEHDVGRVAGARREPLLQQVLGPLRLGVATAELVLVVGADHLRQHGHGDEHHQPHDEHLAAVVVGPAGQAGQHASLRRARFHHR